jgi:hypothetical protein
VFESISIGIKAFLRDAKLFRCVDGIRRNLPGAQIIIADDGEHTEEKDGLYAELIREGHKVLFLPFDSGFGAKSNAIVDHLSREFLLVGSDDFDFGGVDVAVGIQKMQAVLDREPGLSVVSGRVDNRPYERLLFDYDDGSVKEIYFEGDEKSDFHEVDLTVNYSLIRRRVFWRPSFQFMGWERTPTVWDYDVKIGGGEHGAFFIDLMRENRKVAYVPGVNINQQTGEDSEQYNQFRRRARSSERPCFKKRGIKKYVLADGTIDYEEKP